MSEDQKSALRLRMKFILGRQANKVLELMLRDGSLTRLKAFHYGIANLTARIAEMRNAGLNIICVEKTDADGRMYGEWHVGTPARRLLRRETKRDALYATSLRNAARPHDDAVHRERIAQLLVGGGAETVWA